MVAPSSTISHFPFEKTQGWNGTSRLCDISASRASFAALTQASASLSFVTVASREFPVRPPIYPEASCRTARVIAKRHPAIHLERKVAIRPFRIFTVHYKNDDIILFGEFDQSAVTSVPSNCIVGDIGQKSIRIIRGTGSGFVSSLFPLRTQIDKVPRKLQLMLCGIQIDCTCIRKRHTVGIELVGSGP